MATASINDLKIRLLQLKGFGYEKLLHEKALLEDLDVTRNELEQVASEVASISAMLLDVGAKEAESKTQEVPPATQNSGHVTVDQQQLSNILSPNSTVGKSDVVKIEKTAKTSHAIGRRSNG